MRSETIAIHGGYDGDPTTKSAAVPIYQTVAYEFDSADHGAALFNLEVPGYRYSRIANPTVDVLERRVAELEGGAAAIATSTGQAALNLAIVNLADHGGNIVSVPQLYGTTHTLFAHVLPRQGIKTSFAADDSVSAIEALIDADTKAIFCESIGNPAGNITDIAALAACAHRHGIPLVVDNTVATPILLRPIDHGADIVVESLTKFMGGHGTTLAGAVIDSGRFPWAKHADRFPMFSEPDASYHGMVYTKHYGAAAYVARARSVYQRTTGAVLSPFNAFLILQGIETVALRMERHVSNARAVAEFLRADPRVAWVNYAGFEESPYFHLARRYMKGRASSLFTFGIVGGLEGGKSFYDALGLIKRLVNIGDTKSLACHPASTTHRQMNPDEQRHAGVTPDLIRISVGIEHIDDILADLDQALAAAARVSRRSPWLQTDRCAMPVIVHTPGSSAPRDSRDVLEIGLLNNLSDAGLEGGERQFIDRLKHAAGSRRICLRLFTLPEISRGPVARARLEQLYMPFGTLFDLRLDGLIVTGCEPRVPNLRDEPFWESLTAVIDWAQTHTRSTLWSCLAAHAAVLHLDGIERRRSETKISGLYDVKRAVPHALLHGADTQLRVPHSRYNDLAERDLVAAGYTILTRSSEIGVDSFAREADSLFVFLQGHPEYDPDALFREYRRDVLRFLDGTSETYPSMPDHYLGRKMEAALQTFALQARLQRHPDLFSVFPSAARQVAPTWNDDFAGMIFGNWLSGLHAKTVEHAA